MSIIAFVLFFVPGAIAMYYSAQVGDRWKAGDVEGSQRAAKAVLKWSLSVYALTAIFVMIAIALSASTTDTGY